METQLPHLARIFIYPVKSLAGVSVPAARVLGSGALADDRRFAMFDAKGKPINGKRNTRVHLLRSTYDPTAKVLRLATGPGGPQRSFKLEHDRAALEEWLGEFFGFPVTFRENQTAGFPDDTDSPGPTLIGTATLREVAGWFGLTLGQTRARFRANLEIDGTPAFWEDQLFGPPGTTLRFSIGDVLFDGINPCRRCIVPTRDAETGIALADFSKRVMELRERHLPAWAERSRFDHFYRLAVNTRLVTPQQSLDLTTGDALKIIGLNPNP